MNHAITRDPNTGRISAMVETEEGNLFFGELLPYASNIPDRPLHFKALAAFNDLTTDEHSIIITGK